MTSRRVDEILDLIDVGLQTPVPTDTYIPRNVGEAKCWRCVIGEVAEGSDLCAGCREFLLGDTEADPKRFTSVMAERWGDALGAPARQFCEALGMLGEIISATPPDGEPVTLPTVDPQFVVEDPVQSYGPPTFRIEDGVMVIEVHRVVDGQET